RRPPWQAPPHTASLAALTGNRHRPGAISLAHGGVLFCDDAGELPATAADTLRWVLDQRRIILGPGHLVYPARVQLVLATTGCPAGGPGLPLPPGYPPPLPGPAARAARPRRHPGGAPHDDGSPDRSAGRAAGRGPTPRSPRASRSRRPLDPPPVHHQRRGQQ